MTTHDSKRPDRFTRQFHVFFLKLVSPAIFSCNSLQSQSFLMIPMVLATCKLWKDQLHRCSPQVPPVPPGSVPVPLIPLVPLVPLIPVSDERAHLSDDASPLRGMVQGRVTQMERQPRVPGRWLLKAVPVAKLAN